MTINFTKTEALKILNGKREAVATYNIPKDLEGNLFKISEFRLLVRDYFNTLCAYLETPLLSTLQIKKRLKIDDPSFIWIEDFIETTDLSKNTKFKGVKMFIFVRRGKDKIQIPGIETLEEYSQEAKARVNRLHHYVAQLIELTPFEDLNLTISKKTSHPLIKVDIEKCELHYKNSTIQSLVPKKLPHDIFKLAFGEGRHRHEFKLSELTQIGYKSDDIKEGINNFNKSLKRNLKKTDINAILDFSKEPLISSPSSAIKISTVFFKIK